MKVIFTCGGTGGHIYPAIAIYNLLQHMHTDFHKINNVAVLCRENLFGTAWRTASSRARAFGSRR